MANDSIARLRVVFIVWCNLLFSLYVYLCLPSIPISLVFCLINAVLVCLACVGIRARISFFILPNVVVKSFLVVLLLFLACLSLDSIHVKFRKETEERLMNQSQSQGTVTESWITTKMTESPVIKSLISSQSDPFFIVWLMCFVLLLCAEVRLCFSAFYKEMFPNSRQDIEEGGVIEPSMIKQTPPPSYIHCIRRDSEEIQIPKDHLPTYEEANEIVKRRMSLISNDKPCSSRSCSIISQDITKLPPSTTSHL